MNQELVTRAGARAEKSFASGLYCAESVVLALAEVQGISSELLPRSATAFCSGMARTCGTCGALTGAMMGLSLGLGRTTAADSVEPAYDAVRRLIRGFESEFGDRDCHALLGCDIGTPKGQALFRQQRLGERCAKFTRTAAELAARILVEEDAVRG